MKFTLFNNEKKYILSYIILITSFGDVIIPRRKQKIKYSRKIACKHLKPLGDISNSLQPLCVCPSRDLILGRRAYVCQVCSIYDPVKSNNKIQEIYEESRKIAEKKILEKKISLEEFELKELTGEDEIDLTFDEFEEEEEEEPLKFEKRKVGKDEIIEAEEFGDLECPFCGEIFEDLRSHIPTCEFAPDDVNIDDVLPSRKKKRKKTTTPKSQAKEDEEKEKQVCPYCGKEFVRLGRHLKSCPKKPQDAEEENEK
ncbi:MAG: hypothetical protein ACFFAK_01485 [Promethearchaeota archaeon]